MNLKENISNALRNRLPGRASHLKMLPPGRSLNFFPGEEKSIRKSSVLFLLFRESEELYTILIRRPAHMKHHPGQIGLPGGRMEPSDRNVAETALRETHEELGIDPSLIEILGNLSELFISVSRFLIYPVVGWTGQRPEYTVNTHEVEKVIFLPLKHLILRPFSDVTNVETSSGILKVPCIKYDGEIIWGATAMILSEFTDLLKDNSSFL